MNPAPLLAILVLAVIALIILVAQLSAVRQRLKAVELKLQLLLRHSGIAPPQLPFAVSEQVRELAADPSKKIQAIKALRKETGLGLAAAKEIVEKLNWERP